MGDTEPMKATATDTLFFANTIHCPHCGNLAVLPAGPFIDAIFAIGWYLKEQQVAICSDCKDEHINSGVRDRFKFCETKHELKFAMDKVYEAIERSNLSNEEMWYEYRLNSEEASNQLYRLKYANEVSARLCKRSVFRMNRRIRSLKV